MENNMPDRLFQQFSRLVYELCGINLHEGKKALLQARLNKRLRLTGIESYEEYFKFITCGTNTGEFIHFLDSISTNLTYFFRESQHFDFMDKVAQINLPTCIVVGEEDRLTPPKYSRFLQSAIKDSCLTVIPGAGHLAMMEKPEEFNKPVASFLEKFTS